MRALDDRRAGAVLAGYRIESLLGRGGMSVVYLAEDLRLKRRVALKVLAAGLAEDDAFRDRFLRESELAASIDHPNIVPIYEAGMSGDLLFLAMRYVGGGDLKEHIRHGRLDPAEAIGILSQVAIALDAAHEHGLVHRDVKPSNVLLDRRARPDGSDHAYLADFGLVRRISETTGAGDDSRLMGTSDYVAPEQIGAERIDGRADVYSLGCVLYECLVGQLPFRGTSELAVLFAHLEAEAPAASAQRPDLPAALDAVIARALEKDPAQRYPSCGAFVGAALAVAADEASRLLVDAASRAAAGRSELNVVEAELAGNVRDLQRVREQARILTAPATPPVGSDVACPYKGLASFEPVDADQFFGRERLVAELVARCVGAGFLGIVGPSGSGKSSVLRAGLLPALAGGVLSGSEGWRRVLVRPGERPFDELRRSLVSGAQDPLREALDTLPAGGRLLVAVDQLEELFTACRSDAERGAFAAALVGAAVDPQRRALVVVALRADYYVRFASYPELAELLEGNRVLVAPMRASELRRAVELPAVQSGLRVEPGLADALLDEVEGEPAALPLLSTALFELFQKRRENTLTLAAHRASGGVNGAVARLAERTYARIPEEGTATVRAVMLRLVGDGEGEAPVRRRAALAELDLERDHHVADVLATLASSRLVTVGEDSVEVTHEALLREWPRLREWIVEDADGRRIRRHLTRAATDWDAAERSRGELYRGARLAAALDWTAEHRVELNELEREFVTASREASEQETRRARSTNRRLRALLAGVLVLLVAAVAGAVFAAAQRGAARDAATAQLAQRLGALALVEDDVDLSLLLARQAVAIDDTPQTRGYLFASLLRARAAGIMHGQRDVTAFRGIAVSPDGATLAVAGSGGLLLFDARTFEQIGEPVAAPVVADLDDRGFPDVEYSPDGTRLAFSGPGYVRLIDAQTRERLAEASLISDAARIAFTNDGSRLAVLQTGQIIGNAWITIRDARTLETIGTLIVPDDFAGAYVGSAFATPDFALAADGKSLVTVSSKGELAWWDLESHERMRTLRIEPGARALALSPDGGTVAVSRERGIRLVDVRTGTQRAAKGDLTASPTALLFSPDGTTIVSSGLDGAVTIWDTASGAPRETLRGHSAAAHQPAFSPDGETLYTASLDGSAIAWDLAGDRGLGRLFEFTHDRAFHPIFDRHPGTFSPDGQLIALGLKDEGIALWDADSLTPSGRPLLETGGEVKALAFTPDGRSLVAVTLNGMATLWDVASRSLRHGPYSVGSSDILGASLSADGTTLATAGANNKGGVKLMDLATGASLGGVGKARSVGDVALSPNGRMLAFIRDQSGDAEIWRLGDRTLAATLPFGREKAEDWAGYAVAFSPDGRLLATGGTLASVRLWDARAGSLLREFEPGAAVQAMDFNPDGSVLAIGGAEPKATLWDVATGTRIGPSLTAGSRTTEVDVSPDGRRLLQTHGNGQGAVWDIDPESWARRACRLANRTLTRAEWEEFLPGRPYEPACVN